MSSANMPECVISGDLASRRVQYFNDKKKTALDGCIGKPDNASLTYSVTPFLQLLAGLTTEPGKFTGLRVYFASYARTEGDPGNQYIPAGQDNTFALVYVYTKEAVVKGKTIDQDDGAYAFTIIGDKLIPLPKPDSVPPAANTGSNWIKHFRDKIPALIQHGSQSTGNADFKETKSLWYAMKLFTGEGGRPGLVSYINAGIKDADPIASVDAYLACFTEKDEFPQHQLTLIFNLRRKSSQQPAASKAAAGAASPAAAHAAAATTTTTPSAPATGGGFAHTMGDPTDMGMPCPPDTVCNGGGGSIFP